MEDENIEIERTIKNRDYFEAYFSLSIDNKIYNKQVDDFLEKLVNKEQFILEINNVLNHQNSQNYIENILKEILAHPKTAITDNKKLIIIDGFIYTGDNILKNIRFNHYRQNIEKDLFEVVENFINEVTLEDEQKKYEIILNSFDDTSDSLFMYVYFVNNLLKINNNLDGFLIIPSFNIFKDKEDILKSKLKNKINLFYINDKLLDVPYLSYVLNIWKILDEEKYTKFIEEVKQNDEKLLRFVKGFVYLNFDESINGIKKIDKEIIIKHIDFEIIENSDIFNKVSKYFR